MRTTTCMLIIFSFCLALQSCREYIAEVSDQIIDDEYKVYSDALSQLVQLPEGKDILVIREKTTLGNSEFDERHKSYLKKNFGEKISDDLIKEFGAVNTKPRTLQNKFSNSLNIVLISKAETDKIFTPIDEGWKRFYLKYPKSTGIIELSRVAFDASKTKALLYYGTIFDYGKGGIGYYVLLRRKMIDGLWIIEKQVMCWIA